MMFVFCALFICALLLFPLLVVAYVDVKVQRWPGIFRYIYSHPDPRMWLYGILFFCALVYGLWLRILLRRVKAQEASVILGHYFGTILWLPRIIFVRIGHTKEQARWYALPQSWEIAVHSPDALLELEVARGNGYVKRLRRMDREPLTLDREVFDAKADLPVSEKPKPPEPSREEIRELRRYARKRGMFWGYSPASIGVLVFLLISTGPIYIGITILLDTAISTYSSIKTVGDVLALVGFNIFMGGIGLGSLIWGLWMLPRWRWMRRVSRQPREIVEGVIVSWVKPLGMSSSNEETFLKIRLDDDKDRIFRIPHRFIERVRMVGARVRITYMPEVERVTYVLPLNVDQM